MTNSCDASKTVLVTGSSGRLGAALINALHSQSDCRALGVDRVPASTTSQVLDLRDSNALRSLAQTADAIIHCAALHAPHVDRFHDRDFWAVNVDATKALFECSQPSCPFVFTSTTSIYGHALVPEGEAVWVDENLEPRPRDIYDETKRAAELFLASVADERSVTSLRMSRCFPEPEREMALYRLYRGVALRDVVQAHLLALKRPSGYAEYVISGPPIFDRSELPELLTQPWNTVLRHYPQAQALFADRGWAPPSLIDRVYSSHKAINELGYRPRYGFEVFLRGYE